MTLKSFGATFHIAAGWPVALSVNVMDDCNNPIAGAGSSVVAHVQGQDDVVMQSLGDGTWHGTWSPKSVNPQATVAIKATQGALTVSKNLTGSLDSMNDQPVFTADSILNGFAIVGGAKPVAPGEIVSIYSSNSEQLADLNAASCDPAGLCLGNTIVKFGDSAAPIFYASPGQLNVMVPWGIPIGTRIDARIQYGGVLSSPVKVDTAAVLPAPFVNNGTLWAVDYPAGNQAPYQVTASAGAAAGDLLNLYVLGLGATNQTLTDLQMSPASPLATISPLPSVNVGGANAQVVFAGLTPGYLGLYQLQFYVPAGTPTGMAPVTISVAGQTSLPVNLPVK